MPRTKTPPAPTPEDELRFVEQELDALPSLTDEATAASDEDLLSRLDARRQILEGKRVRLHRTLLQRELDRINETEVPPLERHAELAEVEVRKIVHEVGRWQQKLTYAREIEATVTYRMARMLERRSDLERRLASLDRGVVDPPAGSTSNGYWEAVK